MELLNVLFWFALLGAAFFAMSQLVGKVTEQVKAATMGGV